MSFGLINGEPCSRLFYALAKCDGFIRLEYDFYSELSNNMIKLIFTKDSTQEEPND